MRNIILASKSPRRRELMLKAGYTFEVIPSLLEEKVISEKPAEVVMELALQKAKDVFDKCNGTACKADALKKNSPVNLAVSDILVIGADTVVSINGQILGKPASEEEAYAMINSLQGNTHEVYTGVAFVWQEKTEVRTHVFGECTRVTCYPMTDDEIKKYIACGECMDKAGAYGIQGFFGKHIKEICGDYNNVVGLPVSRVYHELMECGLQ